MIIYLRVLLLFFSIPTFLVHGDASPKTKWECGDPSCSQVISTGNVVVDYMQPRSSEMVKARKGEACKIFGRNKDDLLVEVRDKKGLLPRHTVVEYSIKSDKLVPGDWKSEPNEKQGNPQSKKALNKETKVTIETVTEENLVENTSDVNNEKQVENTSPNNPISQDNETYIGEPIANATQLNTTSENNIVPNEPNENRKTSEKSIQNEEVDKPSQESEKSVETQVSTSQINNSTFGAETSGLPQSVPEQPENNSVENAADNSTGYQMEVSKVETKPQDVDPLKTSTDAPSLSENNSSIGYNSTAYQESSETEKKPEDVETNSSSIIEKTTEPVSDSFSSNTETAPSNILSTSETNSLETQTFVPDLAKDEKFEGGDNLLHVKTETSQEINDLNSTDNPNAQSPGDSSTFHEEKENKYDETTADSVNETVEERPEDGVKSESAFATYNKDIRTDFLYNTHRKHPQFQNVQNSEHKVYPNQKFEPEKTEENAEYETEDKANQTEETDYQDNKDNKANQTEENAEYLEDRANQTEEKEHEAEENTRYQAEDKANQTEEKEDETEENTGYQTDETTKDVTEEKAHYQVEDTTKDETEEVKTETAQEPNKSEKMEQIQDSLGNDDSGMFSSVHSVWLSLQEMFSNSPNTFAPSQPEYYTHTDPPPISQKPEDPEVPVDNHVQYTDEETCSGDSSWLSLQTLTWLGITSVVILVFSLGYYYIENSKRDMELVTKINELASELFILQKERSVLDGRLQEAEEMANRNSGEASKYTYEVDSLSLELKQIKEEKLLMEEKEMGLVKRCAMLESNYNKLRQMLSENKQKGERSALIADIQKLKESSTNEILSLKEQLELKSDEIKSLTMKLQKSEDVKYRLEEKLNSKMSEEQAKIKLYQDTVARLEETIEDSKATVIKLEDAYGKLKKDCESLKIEKELAETALQKAHGLKSSESLSSWLETKQIRFSLAEAEKIISQLKDEKEAYQNEKTQLLEIENDLTLKLDESNEKYEKAEKEKIEALTKLKVLSDYFNEKETQLQEELGSKEALWLQKQSDDHTIYEQMRSLREENQTYKSQNETLRKEIIDQETSYKKQIASADEKADGYWVSLRQAERRLKETQIEAAQLRNRLTAIETAGDHLPDDKMNKNLEVNGDMGFGPPTSPPFMLYPSEFIPPPPLISSTPSRPPPLGRISSPTLGDFKNLGDFTPPLPLPPFDLYPPSPPPPQYVHKPQPREGPSRKQKDSQSSNHSSESTDKPQRRNKR